MGVSVGVVSHVVNVLGESISGMVGRVQSCLLFSHLHTLSVDRCSTIHGKIRILERWVVLKILHGHAARVSLDEIICSCA